MPGRSVIQGRSVFWFAQPARRRKHGARPPMQDGLFDFFTALVRPPVECVARRLRCHALQQVGEDMPPPAGAGLLFFSPLLFPVSRFEGSISPAMALAVDAAHAEVLDLEIVLDAVFRAL